MHSLEQVLVAWPFRGCASHWLSRGKLHDWLLIWILSPSSKLGRDWRPLLCSSLAREDRAQEGVGERAEGRQEGSQGGAERALLLCQAGGALPTVLFLNSLLDHKTQREGLQALPAVSCPLS